MAPTERRSERIAKSNARYKSCNIVLNRIAVEAHRMSTSTSTSTVVQQVSSSTVVEKRARKTFPMPLNRNVTLQMQTIHDAQLESLYEHRMNQSIDGLTASLQNTFKEHLSAFIRANESRLGTQVLRIELDKLKKSHAQQMVELEAKYQAKVTGLQAKLNTAVRERKRALEKAKKRRCSGCGKDCAQLMVFCDNKCQKKFT